MRLNAIISLISIIHLSTQTSTSSASSSDPDTNVTSTCSSFDTSVATSSIGDGSIQLYLSYEDGINKYKTSPITGKIYASWSQPFVTDAGITVGYSQANYQYTYQVDLARNSLMGSHATCGDSGTEIFEIKSSTQSSSSGNLGSFSSSNYDTPYVEVQINKAFAYNKSMTISNEETTRPIFRVEGIVYAIPEELLIDYYMGNLKLSNVTILQNFTLSAILGDPSTEYSSNDDDEAASIDVTYTSSTQIIDGPITVELFSTTSDSYYDDNTYSYDDYETYATDSDYYNEETYSWDTETDGYGWETESYADVFTEYGYVYSETNDATDELGYRIVSTLATTSQTSRSASVNITRMAVSTIAHKADQSSVTSVAVSTSTSSASSTSTLSQASSSSSSSLIENDGTSVNIKLSSFLVTLLTLFL